ncbi:hypothetical protein FPQ18DRAFT_308455 [Pyronema domesticum]|nr:hypothetical protein FPQ18DRAFT_308455 [Pyronema domesticum]
MKFTLPLLLSLAALSVSVPTSEGASFDPTPGGNPNERTRAPPRARADLRAVVGDDGKAYRKRQPTKTVKNRNRVKTVRKREAVKTVRKRNAVPVKTYRMRVREAEALRPKATVATVRRRRAIPVKTL